MTMPTFRPTIHWVSPLPPAETDIAHYTARVLPALSAKAEVILWTDTDFWNPALERCCTVKRLDPDRILPPDFTAARRGTGPEIIFIHIGNSWVHHAGFMRLALRLPAIIVLHDLAIQELMLEAVEHGEWEATTYLAGMKEWYGAEGVRVAQSCLDKTKKGAEISSAMPGFELVLSRARAVLTHTQIAYDAVTTRLPHLPCYLLPLPFQIGPIPPKRRPQFGPLRLLQFGWIGPNRRLEQVLDALSEVGDEVDYRLDVMGKIWNPEIVYDKIAALNLEKRVHLHGFVSEAVLDDALRQSHLVLNLRHPSMGEASGSQLRIWNAGAASVVTREGWYASLPEDVAYIIDLEEEASQLHMLFKSLAKNRGQTSAMGRVGRAYLEAHHTPEAYAQALVLLVTKTVESAGSVLKRRRIEQLGPRDTPRDVLSEAQRIRLNTLGI